MVKPPPEPFISDQTHPGHPSQTSKPRPGEGSPEDRRGGGKPERRSPFSSIFYGLQGSADTGNIALRYRAETVKSAQFGLMRSNSMFVKHQGNISFYIHFKQKMGDVLLRHRKELKAGPVGGFQQRPWTPALDNQSPALELFFRLWGVHLEGDL